MSITVNRIFFTPATFTGSLTVMAVFAEGLQVVLVPEQFQITFVGYNVIHYCGWSNPSLTFTLRTQWMLQQESFPDPLPPGAVV